MVITLWPIENSKRIAVGIMLDSIFTFNGCWTVAMCGMQCNTDAPLKHIAPQQGYAGRSILPMGRGKGENPRGRAKNA